MTADEINLLRSSIISTSQLTTVDPRFILAIFMQESKGFKPPVTRPSSTNACIHFMKTKVEAISNDDTGFMELIHTITNHA